MNGKRGRTVAICVAALGCAVLLTLGLTVARKPEQARDLLPPPARAAGPPRFSLGVWAEVRSKGGPVVSEVAAGGPAAKGGLLPGDEFRGVAGYSVRSLDDLVRAMGTVQSGMKIPIVVMRQETLIELSVIPEALR